MNVLVICLTAMVAGMLPHCVVCSNCTLQRDPSWNSWEKIDATREVQDLAMEALLQYTRELEEASTDLICLWEGADVEVKAACRNPEVGWLLSFFLLRWCPPDLYHCSRFPIF